MSKQQIEEDLHERVEDCEEFEDVVVATPKCNHDQIRFLYPGSGKHDVYQCLICKQTFTEAWNETGTTTYKDRVNGKMRNEL